MVYPVIVAALLGASLTAWLMFAVRPSAGSRAAFRLVAIGLTAVLLPFALAQAVAAERLLHALGAVVIIREVIWLRGRDRLPKRLLALADALVWIVPLAVFAPFAGMAAYFFGYDRAVFVLAAVVVLAYSLSGKPATVTRITIADVVLLAVSATLTIWPIWTLYTR